MDLFSHSPISKKVLWCQMWTIFLFFFLPIWAHGGHKQTRILLCTAFVKFYFPSKFCHLVCFVRKANMLCWVFFCCEGEKEKCEHGASYVGDGNFSLLGSMCISVLDWNYQITASECPREQGVWFAIAVCFPKLALFQCWLKFFICIRLF